LIGEPARFFLAVVWHTPGITHRSADPEDEKAARALAARLDPDSILAAAERCIEADYNVQRRLYMPLVLASLTHDLGQRINLR
jgi:hypothetical protein